MSGWVKIKSTIQQIFKYSIRCILILMVGYGALHYWVHSIKDDAVRILTTAEAQVIKDRGNVDKQAIQRFFQEKKKNSRAFATYLYENSGKIPSAEHAKTEWMNKAIARYFFSDDDLQNLGKGITYDYVDFVQRISNQYALGLEKEYGFQRASLSVNETASLNLDHQSLIRSTENEYKNYWVANVGGGLVLDFTVGAVISEITGSIGKALGGDEGKFVGQVGGVILTAIIGYFYDEYQKDKAINRIDQKTKQWLVKMENRMEEAVIKKLDEKALKHVTVIVMHVIDRRVEQYLLTDYFRRIVFYHKLLEEDKS